MDVESVMVTLYIQPDQESLSLGSSFKFCCHGGLACFNRCCLTPTIVLSPYDLLRLKQCLGVSSGELLRRYTRLETEEMSNLPLVLVDLSAASGGGCSFLGAGGCLVYAHRPAACRLFPVTMGSRLTEQGLDDHYFCRRLDYCQGFAAGEEWTVEAWKANQGLAEYEAGRRGWLEIMLEKGIKGPLQAEAQFQDLFATLCYDLDRFRTLAAEPAFLRAIGMDDQVLNHAGHGDLALLNFNYGYLKAILTNGAHQ